MERKCRLVWSVFLMVHDTERIYSFGGSATTGALAKWFKDEFADSEESVGKRTGTSPYQLLDGGKLKRFQPEAMD